MPEDPADTRDRVVARYGMLARAVAAGEQIRDCDPDASTEGDFGPAAYDDTSGLPEAAVRASLGCGNPVAVAALAPGETVLDLGSGGGIDVLLSARRVGPGGRAYGLDASPEMIELARANAAAAGVTNAEFLRGHIEDIPLPDGHVDAVLSNCVINLSADKPRVLAEAFRVLRPGGRLGVSDVIAADDVSREQRAEAEQRTDCAMGTVTAGEYRQQLLTAGFTQITITPLSDAAGPVCPAIVKAVKPAPPRPEPAEARRPVLSGQGGSQGPRAERDACGTRGRGHEDFPCHGRSGEHYADDYRDVKRGYADAPGDPRAGSRPVARAQGRDGEQAYDGQQRQADQDKSQDRNRPRPGPPDQQCRRPAGADDRPDAEQPAGGQPCGIHAGEIGQDNRWLAEFGQRGPGRGIGIQALLEVMPVGLPQPVGEFLDDRSRQLRRQDCQVVLDQPGLGHGPPSRAALMTAEKSRQSARLPASARFPAAVSR
jgi:SAM-dependent methyltransferase